MILSPPIAQGRSARLSPQVAMRLGRNRSTSGFTVIEMLVSLAITLIMMGAVVTLFGTISDSVSGSRSMLELSDRLRAARNQLQTDLTGVTATMKPPARPENDEGYFEIFEGSDNDSTQAMANLVSRSLMGDLDDGLMFTTRSRGAPFVGRWRNGLLESPVAEVFYFVKEDGPIIDATVTPPVRLCTLYRRVMVVVPSLSVTDLNAPALLTPDFYLTNDVSARIEAGNRVPNTLGDLTKRENRFKRTLSPAGTFPFPMVLSRDPTVEPFPFQAATARFGDDVLLTNVIGFDVQVWDPGAPVFVNNGTSVEPGSPLYNFSAANPVTCGAYVDLGYGIGGTTQQPSAWPQPQFAGAPHLASGLNALFPRVYDTWSLHYENDGLAQSTRHLADTGMNGLDDLVDGARDGIVDDPAEFDTQPPYAAPLRGLKITIRVYEPSSKQVREAVIFQSFLPE